MCLFLRKFSRYQHFKLVYSIKRRYSKVFRNLPISTVSWTDTNIFWKTFTHYLAKKHRGGAKKTNPINRSLSEIYCEWVCEQNLRLPPLFFFLLIITSKFEFTGPFLNPHCNCPSVLHISFCCTSVCADSIPRSMPASSTVVLSFLLYAFYLTSMESEDGSSFLKKERQPSKLTSVYYPYYQSCSETYFELQNGHKYTLWSVQLHAKG